MSVLSYTYRVQNVSDNDCEIHSTPNEVYKVQHFLGFGRSERIQVVQIVYIK